MTVKLQIDDFKDMLPRIHQTSFEDATLVSYVKDVMQAKGETVHKITRMGVAFLMYHYPAHPIPLMS